ncbi:WG repeat-containing protein [Echinicola sp. 20G]|uniref:WG repeat-containing protein n=1 Tax=Echinicola sp. 20G TaxID=2781961 RepID=UPI0019103C85|nr:WG repeat-containing protein [Echinicola sp. 20G]
MKIISTLILILGPFLIQAQPTLKGSMESSFKEYMPFDGSYIPLKNNSSIMLYDMENPSHPIEINWETKLFNTIPFQIQNGRYLETSGDNYLIKDIETHNTILKVRKLWEWSAKGGIGQLDKEGEKSFSYLYFDFSGEPIDTLTETEYFRLFPTADEGFFRWFSILGRNSGMLPFSEGLTTIKSPESLFGYMNKSMRIIITPQFLISGSFYEGLASVQNKDHQWGFIDKEGKTVIPFNYHAQPTRFSCGMAQVTNNKGKKGYINPSNELVIPAIYTYATPFYKGHALVRKEINSPILLINKEGKVVERYDSKYYYLEDFNIKIPLHYETEKFSPTLRQLMDTGKAIFKKEGRYGLIDIHGDIILDFNYKVLKGYKNGLMLARTSTYEKGKTVVRNGIIDESGEFLFLFQEGDGF